MSCRPRSFWSLHRVCTYRHNPSYYPRLIVTAKRVPFADYIVHIGTDGRIAEQGTFSELNNGGGYVSSLSLPNADWSHVVPEHHGRTSSITTAHQTDNDSDNPDMPVNNKEVIGSDLDAVTSSPSGSETVHSNDKECDDGMSRRTGDIQIYLYYVRSVGWWATVLFVIAITGFVFSVSFPSKRLVQPLVSEDRRPADTLPAVWVQWWAASNESEPNARLGYWLGIYAMLGGVAIVCLFLSCW